MTQKILLQSLSMDLLRVALSLHRGSVQMANRFKEEALKRQDEIESKNPDPYLRKLLSNTKTVLMSTEKRTYEDILMYSILFQNYAQKMPLS